VLRANREPAVTRKVSEKMGVKPETRSLLVRAPDDAVRAMKLPKLDRKTARRGQFGYIHLFVTTQAEMARDFPKLKPHLLKGGMLWVSWPKGRALGSDLTLPEVIRIGYDHGLVESTTLRIDDTWAGMKFTHPKPGKTYRNSYGKLPAK
jgi:hypothetical protein